MSVFEPARDDEDVFLNERRPEERPLLGQKFDDGSHHFIAMWPSKRKGELGAKKAVTFAEIEALSIDAEREVFSVISEIIEGGGKSKFFPSWKRGELFVQMGHRFGRKDMHSKETEIIATAQTRNSELLFSEGGGGLFRNLGDVVGVFAARLEASSDSAVKVELGFVGGLHS